MNTIINPIKIIKKLSQKPRVAGSLNSKKQAKLIIESLKKLNYKIGIQKIPFIGWDLIEKPELKINQKQIKCLPVIRSNSTPKNGIKGKLIRARKIKTFEAYQWKRYAVVNKNKKVLAYIITRPDMIWLQPIDKPSKVPYFMVYPKTHRKIEKILKSKKEIIVEAKVKVKFIKNLEIQNIITENKAKKKIIISAHYDSILNSPGANDNASGAGVLLKLAEIFSKESNFQFIVFDAEEWNKFGSYAYIKNLKRDDLKKIKALVNIDMIGSGNPYLIISKKFKNKIEKVLKQIKIEAEISTRISPPFDYWPFYKKEIPIILFTCSPYKYCHDPRDTFNKINPKVVKKIIKLAEKVISSLK